MKRHFAIISFLLFLISGCIAQSQEELINQLKEGFLIAKKDPRLSQEEVIAFEELIEIISEDTFLLKRYENTGNQYRRIVAGINLKNHDVLIQEEYYGNDLPGPLKIIENDTFKIEKGWEAEVMEWYSPLVSEFLPRNFVKCVGDYLTVFKLMRMKIKTKLFPLWRKPIKEGYVKIEILKDNENNQTSASFKIPKSSKRKLIIVWGLCGPGKKELEYWLN